MIHFFVYFYLLCLSVHGVRCQKLVKLLSFCCGGRLKNVVLQMVGNHEHKRWSNECSNFDLTGRERLVWNDSFHVQQALWMVIFFYQVNLDWLVFCGVVQYEVVTNPMFQDV